MDSVGIFASTAGTNSDISLTNSGAITVSGDNATALSVVTSSPDNALIVDNSGTLIVTGADGASGMSVSGTSQVPARISNSGDMIVSAGSQPATGFNFQGAVGLILDNSGDLTVTSANNSGVGIFAQAVAGFFDITNSGDITVSGRGVASGIFAQFGPAGQRISIDNSGDINATTTQGYASGILAQNTGDDAPIDVYNSGGITADGDVARGIYATTGGSRSPITIVNGGPIAVNGPTAIGIDVESSGNESTVSVSNTAAIDATGQGQTVGIFGRVGGSTAAPTATSDSPLTILNSGELTVLDTGPSGRATGIYATSNGVIGLGPIAITNKGAIDARATGANSYAYGINAFSISPNSAITIDNQAMVTVRAREQAVGLQAVVTPTAEVDPGFTPISVTNSGDIHAKITDTTGGPYNYAIGIITLAIGPNAPISINNSGSVYAEGGPRNVGVYSYSYYVGNKTTITNTGEIGAQSHLAIDVKGLGNADIFNAGTITGFVDLTEQNDRFVNRAGGVFETKKTSLFGGGEDVFSNQTGATVLAATNASKRESSGFRGLETFKNNGGTISLVDGGVGDTFTLANTPGSADLKFEGGGYLAVDASLRGAGSKADNFIVDGDVSGVTKVMVNNTSTLPGVFNSQGIPVVFVEGQTPKAGNFVMADGPIDTGLFDYDLYFVPTGSGYWELRSFAGASAHMLPKLLTAAQDLWHETSSTWFDRTADLRVVLNGGGAPAYDAGAKSMSEPSSNGLTPGVWIKGGGSRLDRNGSATTSAYGRNYDYDLDNELSTVDLQMGVDMGRYDVLSEGDVLVFGVLGGFVGAGLDYDSLADSFNFSGGQVGAYATYLKDGLFVDTLLNVHLYEIDTPNLGFPDSLNATTVGLRTDAGYRFGSFTGGAFFEPLATIEIAWADIDGFNVGGNKVSFSDDANVRGRIGGRVGTTTEAWEGTMMEPFLIASLWGNLSEDNAATLVSSGTTFQFQDDLDDVWGEFSAGVNLFNFSQTTAVFAKVDYTFGEDVQGLGGKAGMRVAW
ncbi:hypothetical protein [Methyloceanibacter sp. wino2]|uniref:hypothetical protein n=1 Tax=Methyloceanibacter sp. wino2 TaxID=2170729 RepID=UPI000D3E6427|nr:hypothetical protein [Methyloceanibacter sp. wino2]